MQMKKKTQHRLPVHLKLLTCYSQNNCPFVGLYLSWEYSSSFGMLYLSWFKWEHHRNRDPGEFNSMLNPHNVENPQVYQRRTLHNVTHFEYLMNQGLLSLLLQVH